MKRVSRLILVTCAAIAAPALALEALDDEDLSGSLGQAGVTVTITPPVAGYTFSTVIHDSNGFTGFTSPGAIVLGNPLGVAGHTASLFSTAGSPITIDIDAAADVDAVSAGSQGAALGIKITIPANTVLNTGTLSIARSNGGGVAITNQSAVILNSMNITLPGASTLFMTLGNEATGGQMMRFGSNLTSGLSISNFALRDATAVDANGAGIRAGSIALTNAGAANLNVDAKIDVVPTGLQATLTQIGSATTGVDVRMTDLRLGDTTTTSMGNLNILGLNMNGSVLKISGH